QHSGTLYRPRAGQSAFKHQALHVTSSIPATRPPEASTLIAQKTLLNGWARLGPTRTHPSRCRLHPTPPPSLGT
ncbi:unnamed protein product, partial [Tilletia controversa]